MDEKAKKISDILEEKLKENNFIEERIGTDADYIGSQLNICYSYGKEKDQNKITNTIRDILLDIVPAAQTYEWGERTFTLHLRSPELFTEITQNLVNNFNGQAQPEVYEPVVIPIEVIKEMISNGQWENSLEREEVEYNLDNNLYTDQEYIKNLKELNCI